MRRAPRRAPGAPRTRRRRGRSRAPTTVGPTTAAVTQAPSARPASTSAWAACGIGRGDDPRREGQTGPGRGVDVGEDRRRAGRRAWPRASRRAAGASGSHQPRSRPTCTSRGTSTRRTSAATPAARSSTAACAASNTSPALSSSSKRRGAAPGRTVPPRPPSARARPAASSPGPRDAHRPARSGPRPAARPDTRRSRRRRSPASDPGRAGARSCRRAGPPPHRGRRHVQVRERIPGVRIGPVLRHEEIRPERGGQLGEQQRRRPPATPARPVPAGSGTLTRVPAAAPSPTSSDVAGPREQRPTVSWIETVRTPGSSQWIAWTPSP